jgi:hypothetical protein
VGDLSELNRELVADVRAHPAFAGLQAAVAAHQAAGRKVGVRRAQATLRSLTMAVGVDPECTECSDCGDDIGAARKAAAPWATRCIACQKQFERGRG